MSDFAVATGLRYPVLSLGGFVAGTDQGPQGALEVSANSTVPEAIGGGTRYIPTSSHASAFLPVRTRSVSGATSEGIGEDGSTEEGELPVVPFIWLVKREDAQLDLTNPVYRGESRFYEVWYDGEPQAPLPGSFFSRLRSVAKRQLKLLDGQLGLSKDAWRTIISIHQVFSEQYMWEGYKIDVVCRQGVLVTQGDSSHGVYLPNGQAPLSVRVKLGDASLKKQVINAINCGVAGLELPVIAFNRSGVEVVVTKSHPSLAASVDRLSRRQIKTVMMGVGNILRSLHSKGVCHLNVNPNTVLINRAGQAVLSGLQLLSRNDVIAQRRENLLSLTLQQFVRDSEGSSDVLRDWLVRHRRIINYVDGMVFSRFQAESWTGRLLEDECKNRHTRYNQLFNHNRVKMIPVGDNEAFCGSEMVERGIVGSFSDVYAFGALLRWTVRTRLQEDIPAVDSHALRMCMDRRNKASLRSGETAYVGSAKYQVRPSMEVAMEGLTPYFST